MLSSNVGVFAGALGFHHRQGQAVFTKEDIVTIPHPANHTGHALHRVFLLHIRIRTGKFPSHELQIHVDINFSRLKLGEIFRLEGALLLMLFLFGGIPGGQLLDLFTKRLDFRLFFIQQAFLFLDFFGVHNHPLGGNQAFVKGAFFIIGAVAVIDPLDKLEQTPQGGQGVAGLHAALRMYRQIAQLNDKGKLAPGVGIHGKAEGGLMDEGLEIVLVGYFHGLVRGIDPLDRQFQRLAAAHRTHGRGSGVDFLRFDAGGGKEGVFGFRLEKGEVGHGITSPKIFLHQRHFQRFQLVEATADGGFYFFCLLDKGGELVL